MIKKDPTMSIRKRINELKVHKKTVRMAIKQDLSPDFNALYYTRWGISENKTNEIEEEWNKMSEEFILKACKSFWRRVDTIIEKKWWLYWVNVLCQSYFVVYFFKLKLILFYNRVVYYYSRIFLILLPHPVHHTAFLDIVVIIKSICPIFKPGTTEILQVSVKG